MKTPGERYKRMEIRDPASHDDGPDDVAMHLS